MGLYKVAKFYYQPAFHELGPGLELLVNAEKFKALGQGLQKVVESACLASAAETLADFTRHNIEALDPLVKQHGVQLRLWPKDVVAAAGKAWKQVQQEVVQADALAAKVNQSYSAYLAKARAWSLWSDLAALNLREQALGKG
jgi:TRAP-type mannitol/chloroaromatic compound transport system substrate-binding protein